MKQMAKHFQKPQVEHVRKYPSQCASHASMVVHDETAKLNGGVEFDDLDDDAEVVLEGENGKYVTVKDRLDKNMADPNRYSGTFF